ncbi:MAG: aminotransferase class I/II-fold pyridoxal phosphate-dependent enzyme, partial [Candidatus Eisenbacteria bacterium]|nr:aminotransferase class I/II-fold pyridoxal phosphate-dependent enzyme [Candidatus Eisenbacteria bacterium]
MSPAELPLSPHLRDMRPYPFSRLDQLRKEKERQGVDMIDLSIGDLREPTPTEVRKALVEASAKPSQYPRVLGQDELRSVIAQWIENRFQVTTDPDRHILPTNGSKEVLFNLPLAVVDREKRPTVMVPDPAYPVYARGIDAVGGKMYPVVLEESLGLLPNLDKIPSEVW